MRIKFLTVIGELLVMAGLFVGGFLVWHLNEENSIGQEQAVGAQELQAYWEADPQGGFQPDDGWQHPELGRGFAVLRIPKFGEDYQKIIAEGIGFGVLNDRKLGIGHYPGTGMPGELGNFALAGHRLGNGGPLMHVDQLAPGDEIWVTSGQVTWGYQVTELQIVKPHQVEVLDAVPGKRQLTMTTCHPMYQWHERLIVNAELAWIKEGDRITPANELDGQTSFDVQRDSEKTP